jgi:uncharacterized protein YidB (DUF937 family)
VRVRAFAGGSLRAIVFADRSIRKTFFQSKGDHMGLLDGIIGNVMGSMLGGDQTQSPLGSILGGLTGASTAGGNPLLQIALSLLQQNGGLEGVLGKFRESGMGTQADSWVSTGPVSSVTSSRRFIPRE